MAANGAGLPPLPLVDDVLVANGVAALHRRALARGRQDGVPVMYIKRLRVFRGWTEGMVMRYFNQRREHYLPGTRHVLPIAGLNAGAGVPPPPPHQVCWACRGDARRRAGRKCFYGCCWGQPRGGVGPGGRAPAVVHHYV